MGVVKKYQTSGKGPSINDVSYEGGVIIKMRFIKYWNLVKLGDGGGKPKNVELEYMPFMNGP